MGHSKIKIKLNLLLLLFPLLLILISCSPVVPDKSLQTQNIAAPQLTGCWLLQPVSYRLRHSAKLEFQNREEFFEGFMELDLKQNRTHLVIFTVLGVTLLNLEIKPYSFTFADSSSHNKREQHLAAAVAGSVQKIFFSLMKYNSSDSQLQVNFRNISGSAELFQIDAKQSNPDWVVNYSNYHDYPCGRLPQSISLQNNRPKFTLTLWLHKAGTKENDAQ